MTDRIPLLTAPRDGVSFDVIVPSLPGFGFSSQPRARGMSVARIAGLMTRLMTEVLGHARFARPGSDLGADVLQQIALQSPGRLSGLNLSGTNPYVGQVPDDLSPEEAGFVERARGWMQSEMACAMMHASKPGTVVVALNDSPAGLAASVLENFHASTDVDDFVARYGRDRLLANLTLYRATGTIGSSMRLQYETLRLRQGWTIYLIGLMALFSFVPESAVLDWSALYLSPDHGAGVTVSGMAFALFSACLAAMRFCGDAVRNRVGAVPLLRVSWAIAAAGMTLAAIAPSTPLVLAGFALAGIGLANLVPSLSSAVGRQGGADPGGANAAVSFIGYGGMLVAPTLIGVTAEQVGLTAVFLALSGLLLAVAWLAPAAARPPMYGVRAGSETGPA